MAAQQNFRSAFNGFNREDVARYLEYLNNKYQGMVQQLNEEVAQLRAKEKAPISDSDLVIALQTKCDDLTARLAASEETCQSLREQLDAKGEEPESDDLADALAQSEDARKELEDKCAGLTEKLEQSEGKCRELEQTCEELRAAMAVAEAKPVEAPQIMEEPQEELATYRLAQQVERSARERAELMYFQASGVLAQANARVTAAAEELAALTEESARQLTQVQMALSKSKQSLQDAASLMNAIKP